MRKSFLAVLFLVFSSGDVAASSVRSVTLDEATRNSVLVFEGSVRSAIATMNTAGNRIQNIGIGWIGDIDGNGADDVLAAFGSSFGGL